MELNSTSNNLHINNERKVFSEKLKNDLSTASLVYGKWFQNLTKCCTGCMLRHINISQKEFYLFHSINDICDVFNITNKLNSCPLCLNSLNFFNRQNSNRNCTLEVLLQQQVLTSGYEDISGFRLGLRLAPSLLGCRDLAALCLVEQTLNTSLGSSQSSSSLNDFIQEKEIPKIMMNLTQNNDKLNEIPMEVFEYLSMSNGYENDFKPHQTFHCVIPIKDLLKNIFIDKIPTILKMSKLTNVFDGTQENIQIEDMKGIDLLIMMNEMNNFNRSIKKKENNVINIHNVDEKEDVGDDEEDDDDDKNDDKARNSSGPYDLSFILNMESNDKKPQHSNKKDSYGKKRKWQDHSSSSSSSLVTGETLINHCMSLNKQGRKQLSDWFVSTITNQLLSPSSSSASASCDEHIGNNDEEYNVTTNTTIEWKVQVSRAPIYLGGRYLKLARDVPQSKWIIENEGRKGRSSVDEIISQNVALSFKVAFNINDEFDYDADNSQGCVKFHAAGREDIDVRMLGRGRPFILEVINPRCIPFKTLYQPLEALKCEVNSLQGLNMDGDVKIEAFQHVPRRIYDEIIEGAAEKQKTYRCVVWVSDPVTASLLVAKLHSVQDLIVMQDTPLRVLHRRTPLVREKVIHSMTTQFTSPHWFTLDIVASAGTYIKEFVHSDLGRTRPNIAELLQVRSADILQLDVLGVHTTGLLA